MLSFLYFVPKIQWAQTLTAWKASGLLETFTNIVTPRGLFPFEKKAELIYEGVSNQMDFDR